MRQTFYKTSPGNAAALLLNFQRIVELFANLHKKLWLSSSRYRASLKQRVSSLGPDSFPIKISAFLMIELNAKTEAVW